MAQNHQKTMSRLLRTQTTPVDHESKALWSQQSPRTLRSSVSLRVGMATFIFFVFIRLHFFKFADPRFEKNEN